MPISAAPAAPQIRQPRTTKTKTEPVKPKVEERKEGLMGMAQIGHAICLMTKQYADAGAVEHFADPLCTEVAKLADSNEKIARGIDAFTAVGPYTALLTVGIQFTLQIAANHKRVDPNMLAGAGIIHPDVLEAEQKANILRMRTEALQRQKAAQEAHDAAKADMENEG